MQRIIYLSNAGSYYVIDAKSKEDLPCNIAVLAANDVQVICVFDVETLEASFICKSFESHMELLKASSRKSLFGKFFSKITSERQTDYSMLSRLIRPEEGLSDITSIMARAGR